jgi:hypothetical protein
MSSSIISRHQTSAVHKKKFIPSRDMEEHKTSELARRYQTCHQHSETMHEFLHFALEVGFVVFCVYTGFEKLTEGCPGELHVSSQACVSLRKERELCRHKFASLLLRSTLQRMHHTRSADSHFKNHNPHILSPDKQLNYSFQHRSISDFQFTTNAQLSLFFQVCQAVTQDAGCPTTTPPPPPKPKKIARKECIIGELGDGHLSGCFSKWLALLQDHELRKIIFVLNKQIEPLNQHKPKS